MPALAGHSRTPGSPPTSPIPGRYGTNVMRPSTGCHSRVTDICAGRRAVVRFWVRADRAALDPVLYNVVLAWLERDWPFHSIEYAPRA
jgi:hypothetical protein